MARTSDDSSDVEMSDVESDNGNNDQDLGRVAEPLFDLSCRMVIKLMQNFTLHKHFVCCRIISRFCTTTFSTGHARKWRARNFSSGAERFAVSVLPVIFLSFDLYTTILQVFVVWNCYAYKRFHIRLFVVALINNKSLAYAY